MVHRTSGLYRFESLSQPTVFGQSQTLQYCIPQARRTCEYEGQIFGRNCDLPGHKKMGGKHNDQT